MLTELTALAGPRSADSRIAEVISAAAEDVRTRAAAAFGARTVKLSTGGYCADLVGTTRPKRPTWTSTWPIGWKATLRSA